MYYLRFPIYDFARKAAGLLIGSALSAGIAGCNGNFFEPSQLGRFRPTPAVNVILDSLGAAEEPSVAWENGEEPKPRDIVATKGDYTLRSGDVVRVSIFELLQEGATVTNEYVVSETGRISIPEVGIVQAGGLTEVQLEQEIRRILAPAVLKNPSVSVALVNSQQQMFSVLGVGVPQPGRYPIPQHDFRLTDALAAAGGPSQFNVSYIYVSRAEESAQPAASTAPAHEMELIEPQSKAGQVKPRLLPSTSSGPITGIRPSGVPQPSEPAEKFETQQEMLDLITPFAKEKPRTENRGQATEISDSGRDANPQSAIRNPQSGVGSFAGKAQSDISASVLPGGFRLVVPPGSSSQSELGPQDIVQTPVEFGSGSVAPATKTPPSPDSAGRIEWVFRDGKWVPVPVQGGRQKTEDRGQATEIPDSNHVANPQSAIRNPQSEGQSEWVFKDGQWVQVRKGQSEPSKPPLAAVPTGPTLPPENEKLLIKPQWEQAAQTRLIKIPADRLLAGDPRYNVVIKPGDVIHVPVDIVGEFCITGNVVHGGYINMTGRPMTLKQAIAAAGGLGPGAWPKYCEVVRRIGAKKEEIVMVDLDKIASGEQPDFFIKPNDLINVGTHPSSQWRTAMRNAQKPAYGFAFVYDRNFSDADYGLGQRNRQ